MLNIIRAVALSFFFILLLPRTSFSQEVKIPAHAKSKYNWKDEWSQYAATEIRLQREVFLNDSIVPREDVLLLCPSYYTMSEQSKVNFWTLVIIAITKFESGFDPGSRYLEGAPINAYSEGLLQLSYGDENNYKGLFIDKAKGNILDPEANLRSGVIILARQLKKKKKLFTKKSLYWSVLTKKKTEIITFFSALVDQVPGCK
jgi:hypothetical protein